MGRTLRWPGDRRWLRPRPLDGFSAPPGRECARDRPRSGLHQEGTVTLSWARHTVASMRDFGVPEGSLHGVLAWYSLIHIHPDDLPEVSSGIARALTHGGHLLIGFFEGASARPFDHAVAPAYYWSVEQMRLMLSEAGFEVSCVETRQDPERRPHAA